MEIITKKDIKTINMLKRIKYFFALRKARNRLLLVGKVIDAVDREFTRKGVSRKQRRQFWYEFIHNKEMREKFVRERIK